MNALTKLLPIAIALLLFACNGPTGDHNRWDTSEPTDVDVPMDAYDDVDGTIDVPEADPGPVDPDEPLAEHDLCGLDWDDPDDTACPIQLADDFQDCEGEPGVVFNGSFCVEVQSCDCPGPLCAAFASLQECAITCADEGWCRPEAMPEHFPGGLCPDETCTQQLGELGSCVHGPEDPTTHFEGLLESHNTACFENNGVAIPCEIFCYGSGGWCCRHTPTVFGDLDEEYLLDLCRLSLLRRTRNTWCMIYDP